MNIKTLMENTAANPSFQTEHGLSLYIETEKHKILFDTGASSTFANNAEKMNVDLSKVDIAVLSHAHYDHSGGLHAFLSMNKNAPVYLSQYTFDEYLNGADDYIGVDGALQGHPQLVPVKENCILDEGLDLYTGEGLAYKQLVNPYGLNARRDGVIVPDDFRHEQYLLITEENKRILFSGCSHRGIINIVHWFKPDILIGGFHLMQLDPQGDGKAVLDATAKDLMSHDTLYYTCHCTGVLQYEYLKAQMKDQVQYLACGQEITL